MMLAGGRQAARVAGLVIRVGRRAGIVLALGALPFSVLAACGEDDPPVTTTEDAGVDASPDPEPRDAGKKTDSGPAGPTGPEVDCPIGTAIEAEDNGTPATANSFTELAFCGVLATSRDVDYAVFQTPPGMKLSLFQGVIEGKVEFDIMQNGKTFGPGDVAQFGAGETLVKIYTKDGKPCAYRFRIAFDAM